MKRLFVNGLIAAILTITSVAIFDGCKKNETINTTDKITQKVIDNIEYMDIPCVDFSRIKKENNMLKFESWKHYAEVIDALLQFTYKYTDSCVNKILAMNEGIDNNDLNDTLQEHNFYQFMPLYSFCRQLQFDNNAFEQLRIKELEWLQNPVEDQTNNPFDEMELGCVQSALHNTNGDVMIGDEVFNPKNDKEQKDICLLSASVDNSVYNNGYWPTYSYDKKTREGRAFLTTNTCYSYAKTSMYYFNKNTRIVWLCKVSASVQGKRLQACDPNSVAMCTFNGGNNVFASVVERYQWYTGWPNYLHPYKTPIVFSTHTAPGFYCTLSR